MSSGSDPLFQSRKNDEEGGNSNLFRGGVWGTRWAGVCQYDFYGWLEKERKKGRKIHRFNNPRYKNGPLLLTNENLFGKDSEIREL